MLRDVTLGQYFPGNTVVHRLDPRTKILLVVIYIIALFQAQGWISVMHRLPKQQARTLVCTESGSVCVAKFYPQDGEWSGPAGKKVRYWMPMPEPPEEVTGDA